MAIAVEMAEKNAFEYIALFWWFHRLAGAETGLLRT
jgi:hypothetical protein